MKTINIIPHSSDWPKLFAAEAEKITATTGLQNIEHIGSTAVEGLSAKPVIDMMAAVDSLTRAQKYVESLAKLGYVYIPELEQQTPDRKFFQKQMTEGPWYHLSLSEKENGYWRDHILFRDYLRSHPDARNEYENLKKSLATQFVDDFEKYNAGKTEFINSIILGTIVSPLHV